MNICPFCREAVHDEAQRCPHCTSTLGSKVAEDDRRVTYVVDRDLIRFGKFAGAVLVMFLIIGAYSFGFKLEVVLERARELQGNVDKLLPALRTAQSDLERARADLEAQRRSANALAKEMSQLGVQARADAAAIRIRLSEISIPLTDAQKSTAATALTQLAPSQPRPPGKFWPAGTTLTIRFLDGDPALIARVKVHIAEWLVHTSLRARYVDIGDAMVRVSFKAPGSWSYLGTDALGAPQDKPTLNLGFVTASSSAEDVRRYSLHEFGHTLGLIHELQNPRANIPWDKEAVYRELAAPPRSWDKARIDREVFGRVSEADLPFYREFDPESIMTYPVPAKWTGGKLEIGRNDRLSAGDIALVARLYPKPSSA